LWSPGYDALWSCMWLLRYHKPEENNQRHSRHTLFGMRLECDSLNIYYTGNVSEKCCREKRNTFYEQHTFSVSLTALNIVNMKCLYDVSNYNMTTTGLIYIYCNVLGFYIHDGTLLHSKSQYTRVKHSRQLLEHTYTSDPHGLGTPTPIEFFQQDLLWQSSNTHCHSYSQRASKHTLGQSIVGLSIHLHTTTAPRRIHH
jgi:hypothetical protein